MVPKNKIKRMIKQQQVILMDKEMVICFLHNRLIRFESNSALNVSNVNPKNAILAKA